jgi:hypothetical protein
MNTLTRASLAPAATALLLAASGCGDSAPTTPLGLPTIEIACGVADVNSAGATGRSHNVEFVSAAEAAAIAGRPTCGDDVAEAVGPAGYILARVADPATGRRSLAVSVGPGHSPDPWIDDPAVYPATVSGWHFTGEQAGGEALFVFGAITAIDPTRMNPEMDGHLLVYDASGGRVAELSVPRPAGERVALVHDVCPGTGGARLHAVVSTGTTPLGMPEQTATTPEEAEAIAAGGLMSGCVAYALSGAGAWAEDPALGRACSCAELPGRPCQDPCYQRCEYGLDRERIVSDPVCGPNEECTGAASIEDIAELGADVGVDDTSGVQTANCVAQASLPAHCSEDLDCVEGTFGYRGDHCLDGQCVSCRADTDCDPGQVCRDGDCY